VGTLHRKVCADGTIRQFFASAEQAQEDLRNLLLTGVSRPVMLTTALRRTEKAQEDGPSDGDFDIFLSHVRDTLEDLSVPPEMIDSTLGSLATTRNYVLNEWSDRLHENRHETRQTMADVVDDASSVCSGFSGKVRKFLFFLVVLF
jgi:hypothetical protein